MRKSTREWVRKAEADHRLAVRTARSSEPFHDHVCFLCQQAAEKYLKAVVEELGLSVPHTHLLVSLLGSLLPAYPELRSLNRGLKFLTRFAVQARYPGYQSTKRQAIAALRWSALVRTTVRGLLGLS